MGARWVAATESGGKTATSKEWLMRLHQLPALSTAGEMGQAKLEQPVLEAGMKPKPIFMDYEHYGPGSSKLAGKIAIITGGDSGIGRSIAVHYAREGAHGILVVYLNEHEDAKETQRLVQEEHGGACKCEVLAGDIGDEGFCAQVANKAKYLWGRVDVLVNNAGEQRQTKRFEDLDMKMMEHTFRTNIFSMFYLVHYCLPMMARGSSIINSTSVNAFKGHKTLVDYTATKGAITAFTRSLSQNLVERGIRVNAVAPGPVWTPLIVSSFSDEEIKSFGSNVPMQRPAHPYEVAPSYVFLASDSYSSYFTGQVLHPNGGTVVNA
eukprot:TRINITY_DN7659_c1_g1_i1.p1 TRINITY_DN7659_c1_g1~~TRINITY_DN7659_c1_g1_i1.p1  ORF type:complete len:322 (+),score=94.88 TRINITY_DN7659_c1_g1_i1:325-1290(+)